MKKSERRMILCITLLVLTLGFIWGNSVLPVEQSTAVSQGVQHVVVEVAPEPVRKEVDWEYGYYIIRKWMHGAEFALLGMELAWLFLMLGGHKLLPVCAGMCCGWIDEGLQFIQPGRGPSVRDACIDCVGVVAGVAAVYLLRRICREVRKLRRRRDRADTK